MAGRIAAGIAVGQRGPKGQAGAAGHGHVPCRRVAPAVSMHSLAYPTHVKELRPQGRIAVVLTAPERGAGEWRDLADTAHLRTEVMGFQVHGDSVWLEHGAEGISDLLPDAFLHRKTPGKKTHQPSELGDANDVFVRDIAYVGMPVKRQCVVLTEAKKVDGPLDDLAQPAFRPTAALGLEDREQFGMALITLGAIKYGTKEPL